MHAGYQIIELWTHPEPYVTTSALATYWRVTAKDVERQIDSGLLKATRVGHRSWRISTVEARRFEKAATVKVSRRRACA